MTKEREAEIRELAIPGASCEDEALGDLLAEIDRLRDALFIIAKNCGHGYFGYQDGDRFGGFYPGELAREALEEK